MKRTDKESPEKEPPWKNAREILAVRLDAMGDLLMTTPALRALKESRPGRRVTLLTSSAGAEAAPCIPEVDDFIVYDAPWMKAEPRGEGKKEESRLVELLAARKFDAAVIFTVFSQNPLPAALVCRMAGIPLRLAHCHENPYGLLTDWVPDPEPAQEVRHEARRQLDLVESVGCTASDDRLSFRVSPEARVRARAVLAHRIDFAQPWALVHPGASALSRRYAPEGFAEAADVLARKHGWQVVFTGSEEERPLIEGIRGRMSAPSVSLAGKMDLEDLAAVISLAPIAVSNNTGPAHLAAAVGTPLVDIYALTNPQHTPWRVPHRLLYHDVPCRFCYKSVCPEGHHACLRRVSPESVAEAAVSLAAETKRRPAEIAA